MSVTAPMKWHGSRLKQLTIFQCSNIWLSAAFSYRTLLTAALITHNISRPQQMAISHGSKESQLAVTPVKYHWRQLPLNNSGLGSNEMALSTAQTNSDRLLLKGSNDSQSSKALMNGYQSRLQQITTGHSSNRIPLAAVATQWFWPCLQWNVIVRGSNKSWLSAAQTEYHPPWLPKYCWPCHLQMTHRFYQHSWSCII